MAAVVLCLECRWCAEDDVGAMCLRPIARATPDYVFGLTTYELNADCQAERQAERQATGWRRYFRDGSLRSNEACGPNAKYFERDRATGNDLHVGDAS